MTDAMGQPDRNRRKGRNDGSSGLGASRRNSAVLLFRVDQTRPNSAVMKVTAGRLGFCQQSSTIVKKISPSTHFIRRPEMMMRGTTVALATFASLVFLVSVESSGWAPTTLVVQASCGAKLRVSTTYASRPRPGRKPQPIMPQLYRKSIRRGGNSASSLVSQASCGERRSPMTRSASPRIPARGRPPTTCKRRTAAWRIQLTDGSPASRSQAANWVAHA